MMHSHPQVITEAFTFSNTEIGCCIMIARLLHYYIITKLNPVFIKFLKSDGREERKRQGLCMVYGFVG